MSLFTSSPTNPAAGPKSPPSRRTSTLNSADLWRLLDQHFALYLAEEKIEPEVVENMGSWPHSGFGVDQ